MFRPCLIAFLTTARTSGPSFLEHLDKMPMVDRKLNAPLMMPISEKYKDMGTVIVGKVESGHLRKGDSLVLMPNRTAVEVTGIYNEMEEEVDRGLCGDNVRVRLRGVDDEDISPGFVLTALAKPVHAVRQFEAQLAILDHKNIICAGYSAVMHIHTLAEEVTLPVSPERVDPSLSASLMFVRRSCTTLTKQRVASQRNLLSSRRKVSFRSQR
jgi:translation elongation factor EF-1alpha